MNGLILTYDIGTTGNKCTFFDTTGRQVASHTVPYETLYPAAGWAEQRPLDFWESVVTGTRSLLDKCGIEKPPVEAIGLCGHMNGCIPVDAEGEPLFHDILHSDSRSFRECQDIRALFDGTAYYRITGNRLDPHYTLPKLLWFKKHYPDLYKKTACVLASKDYISFKLTGNLGITDYSDASLTGMLDITRKCWSHEIVEGMGLDMAKLPQIKRSYDLAGRLTGEAAALLGLTPGIPVMVGGGDGACATKGAGVMEKHQAYNYIGSSSWICTLNDGPVLDREARTFNFYDLDGKNCNACGTVQCATISYDWVLHHIGRYEVEQCKKDNTNVFDYVDGVAAAVPPGSNGVYFLPYLMGERTPVWDENTRGAFIGFTLHHKREDLFRATYEGIAYALRSVLDVYEENGIRPQSLTLTGGGAISLLWNEIMANVYGRPVRIRKHPREATSLGAAIAAGVGAGIFNSFSAAAGMVEYERELTPDPAIAADYTRYYSIYKSMYPQLKEIFREISNMF